MKWIGQHIYDQVSRFRGRCIFEEDLYFEKSVYFQGDTVTFESGNADDPIVTIKNTSNAANDMASLNFVKERNGGTAATGDNLGEIYFSGKDAGGNTQEYGRILSEIDVATHGQESGRLKLGVASHEGVNGYGLTMQGGSVGGEVDVTVGLGAASVTTISGDLSITTGFRLDNVDVTTIQTSGEPFGDNDTSLMTSASIQDKIESFGYTTNTGDITSVVAGSNISGGGTSGDVTLNVATASDSAKGVVQLATTAETTNGTDHGKAVTPDGLKDGYQGSTNVDTVGTIETGEWRGTVIASTYLDANTAHLNVNQTFTGETAFSRRIIQSGDQDTLFADGTALHIDSSEITDTSTSASGTASLFRYVNIGRPRLHATNASVTTTDASTLYIAGDPSLGTNQTITNAYAIHVDQGLVKFDGALTVGGTITGTIGTATQGSITSCANLATVGTVTTGTWQGTAVASAYLDADTAHLTTDQTFTGVKTFNEAINKKSLHFLYTTNKFTLDTSNELYFSLSDADRDVATGNEDQVGVMAIVPLTGILKQVIINSSSTLSARSFDFRLYRVPSGADADSGGEIKIATVSASAGPAAQVNKVISFVTDPGDGTNDISYETGYNATTMFTAGDRILLSLQTNSDAAGNPKINSVLCFELDESTI